MATTDGKMSLMKFLIALFLIFCFSALASGQNSVKKVVHHTDNINWLTVKVRLSDAVPTDTLKINLFTLIASRANRMQTKYILASGNEQGIFIFKIPVTSAYGYFDLQRQIPLADVGIDAQNFVWLTSPHQFYWKANDNILIDFHKINDYNSKQHIIDLSSFYRIKVLGKGAGKYEIRLKTDSMFHMAYAYSEYVPFSDKATKKRDSVIKCLAVKTSGVSKMDLDILRADYLFDDEMVNLSVLSEFINSVKRNKSFNNNGYLSKYSSYENKRIASVSTEAKFRSYNFEKYAQIEAAVEFYLKNQCVINFGRDGSGPVRIEDLIKIFNEKYSNKLRDKIIANLFFSSYSAKNYVTATSKALGLITTPEIKRTLMILLNPRSEESAAYNFNLPDTSGNYHSLSSLKGKVVYQDFYFTGCGGCAGLYQSVLKEVEDYYNGNSNVVFVSINSVASLNYVKTGIKSGKYNSSTAINLYTDGKGVNDDMIRYYGVSTYPTTLLIDKQGRIARYNTEDIKTKDGLIKQINRLLKE